MIFVWFDLEVERLVFHESYITYIRTALQNTEHVVGMIVIEIIISL